MRRNTPPAEHGRAPSGSTSVSASDMRRSERAGAGRGRHAAVRHNHGNTVAAWAGVLVILVGACVAAAALPADKPWLFWVGIGIAALGALAGKVLSMLGFGPAPGYHQEGDAELRDELFGSDGRGEQAR
jgi:hypothetical protein